MRSSGPDRTMRFHILSFGGPDGYSRAGGVATRVEELVETLRRAGRVAAKRFAWRESVQRILCLGSNSSGARTLRGALASHQRRAGQEEPKPTKRRKAKE